MMDANPTPQTVAQAVQAATQAAQQVSQSPSVQGSAIDNLTCQWHGCGERCDSAESLYDHVCERHVGRKSTNNLNLTCGWGACRTTTVKRDHITSHIRVHVPLKPHKCEFCGKAFKRPQDLKKHVKTHADDSVLMSSPQNGANGRTAMATGTLGQPNAFAAAGNYYGGHHDNGLSNPYASYQPMSTGPTATYPGPSNNGQYAGYGNVSYPNSSGAMNDLQSIDTRRRAIEALNDFLGDIKRRAIDPASYYDVGHRLQSNTLPLPVGTGYNTGYNNSGSYNNYNAASLLESFTAGGNPISTGGGNVHGLAASHNGYSLPLPNARTKNDLQDIDRFLEQLQATVYEASHHAAAAGVVQNGIHNTYTGDFNFGAGMGHTPGREPSHSPSSIGDSSMGGTSTIGSLPGLPVSQGGMGTPALTPASVSSYDSAAHSPLSSYGHRSSLGGMYPSLPTVPPTSQLGHDYPTTTSAPPSSLSYDMEGFDARHHSDRLRKQRRQPSTSEDTDMLDLVNDCSRTPKASEERAKGKPSSSIDPALRDGEKSPSESGSTPGGNRSDNGAEEQWIENVRVIEALRKWVSQRLNSGEYDNGENPAKTNDDQDSKNIEIAKLAEATMADVVAEVNADNGASDEDVKYPTLPSA